MKFSEKSNVNKFFSVFGCPNEFKNVKTLLLTKNWDESIDMLQIRLHYIEYTTTESGNGGTLIYIEDDIKYKLRKDLQINKSNKLKSTFIEVIDVLLTVKGGSLGSSSCEI